jgi:hypothetical protein
MEVFSVFSMNGFNEAWERITTLCEMAALLNKPKEKIEIPAHVNPLKF